MSINHTKLVTQKQIIFADSLLHFFVVCFRIWFSTKLFSKRKQSAYIPSHNWSF